MPTPNFQLFNALWNVVNCSIAGFLLYQMWQVIVLKKGKPEDKGGYYLAVSLVFWTMAGVLDTANWLGFAKENPYWPLIYNLLRCWLSTWNSVMILFAIHYFDLVPRWFVDVVRHPDWKKWVRGLGIGVMVLTAFEGFRLLGHITAPDIRYDAVYTWDFFFSTVTSGFLMILIVHILRREDFHRLVGVGGFLILLVIMAQFLQWRPDWFEGLGPEWVDFLQHFFLISYKSLLLIVFALIMLSWAMRAPVAETAAVTLSEEDICQRFGIAPRDIDMLLRLARGETREAITPFIFPGKTGREPVDERQKELATRFNVPNNVVAVLVFAFKNGIVPLEKL